MKYAERRARRLAESIGVSPGIVASAANDIEELIRSVLEDAAKEIRRDLPKPDADLDFQQEAAEEATLRAFRRVDGLADKDTT